MNFVVKMGKQPLLSKQEPEECEKDPFYSEENWNALIKAKEQLDRGEGILFDIEKVGE